MSGKLLGIYCKGKTEEICVMLDVYKRLLNDETSETELIRAGIIPEYLEFMKGEERQKILMNAGLDPAAFDF